MITTGGCQAHGRRAGPRTPPNRQIRTQPSRKRAALIHESQEEVFGDAPTLTRRNRQRDATRSCSAPDRVPRYVRDFLSGGYLLHT